jgi:hypothetical protein
VRVGGGKIDFFLLALSFGPEPWASFGPTMMDQRIVVASVIWPWSVHSFFFLRLWSVHSCDVSTAFIRFCDFASNCMEVTHAWTKASVGATISACGFDEGCNLCDWIIVQPDGIAIE